MADNNRVSRALPASQSVAIVLVVAMAENRVIGRDNALPWRLKSDMQHFRRATIGRPVVMGRKTFQSLAKPLQGRTTIVVTRDRSFAAPQVVIAGSLPAALAAARGDALRHGTDEIIVAGGSDIYAQAMPLADRLVLTLVHDRPEGDAVFPEIDNAVWHEVQRVEHQRAAEDDAAFAIVDLRRAPPVHAAGRDG
jgi:dihydrofolate reductase